MESNEILIPITLFLCTFGILYVYFSTRHKERLTMIEKGADPSLFHSKKVGSSYTTMRIGMFLVGISLGFLIGNILTETTRLEEGVAYISMISLCGGLSLVLYYLLIEKKIQK